MDNVSSILAILFISLLCNNLSNAQIKLPALVSDSMILQRDKPVKIWGWSSGGAEVTVIFNNKKYTVKPDASKRWEVMLASTKAGGPYELTITTGDFSKTIKEILFGDVWLCSGQSNMGFTMQDLANKYPNDLADAENNLIREFAVGRQISFTPKESTSGLWKRACPANIGKFSAVAYYLAKNLNEKYKVPIGIIHTSWGGTPAQAWTSEEGLKSFDKYLQKLPLLKDSTKTDSIAKGDKSISTNWYKQLKQNDKGLLDLQKAWYAVDIPTKDWQTMKVPGYWDKYGAKDVHGVVWARKEITLTKSMINHDAILNLGMIDDADSTYFNGEKVGNSPNKYAFRKYTIPARLLKEGVNIIAIRIVDTDGLGGFVPDKKYNMLLDNQEIDLTGDWQYQIGTAMSALPVASFTNFQNQPTALYNGMLAPFVSYTIKGAAWYQGESNASQHEEYKQLLTAMITDWRTKLAQGDFPFLIVQLANYLQPKSAPSESNWAGLRNAQLLVSQEVPNSALAVTIDLGETYNIHPQNKGDVGKRLALAAEKIAYHEKDIAYSGPTFSSMKIENHKIILSFNNIGSGLMSKDADKLKQFAIAGEDKKFVWANATIKGNTIIVESDAVQNPVAVRYAWADNPIGCNLYNKEGLPASPFRTDNWELENKK